MALLESRGPLEPASTRRLVLASLFACFHVSACSSLRPVIPVPGHPQIGTASWYGKTHAGFKTASGARFDPSALTAVRPSRPLGTRVKVAVLQGDSNSHPS